MPAKLEPGKKLRREFNLYGVGEVVMTITSDGLKMQAKGSKTVVEQGWVQIVQAMRTPLTVKSYLNGRPYELLQELVRLAGKRKTKKLKKSA